MESGCVRIDIREDWCKSCGICVAFCPNDVLALLPGEKANVVNKDSCSGCGLCERLCPDLAIEIRAVGAMA